MYILYNNFIQKSNIHTIPASFSLILLFSSWNGGAGGEAPAYPLKMTRFTLKCSKTMWIERKTLEFPSF